MNLKIVRESICGPFNYVYAVMPSTTEFAILIGSLQGNTRGLSAMGTDATFSRVNRVDEADR
jgi:hypothetical protein